jgi:hypothetical protein
MANKPIDTVCKICGAKDVKVYVRRNPYFNKTDITMYCEEHYPVMYLRSSEDDRGVGKGEG